MDDDFYEEFRWAQAASLPEPIQIMQEPRVVAVVAAVAAAVTAVATVVTVAATEAAEAATVAAVVPW
jgi:hypothetical protein